MSDTLYLIFLIVGVPAIAAVLLLTFGCCRMGGQCSREEEAQLAGALEGDLTPYIKSLNRGEVM
jgi:hypothetical protein